MLLERLAPESEEEMIHRVAQEAGGYPLLLQIAGRMLAVDSSAVQDWLHDTEGATEGDSSVSASAARLERLLCRLAPPLGEFLDRLAVFEADFDGPAAVAVVGQGEDATRQRLDELVHRGWLEVREQFGGFRLHSQVRTLCLDRLVKSGREPEVRRAHAEALFTLVTTGAEEQNTILERWKRDLSAAVGFVLSSYERGEAVQHLVLLGGLTIGDFLLTFDGTEAGLRWVEILATVASETERKDLALTAVLGAARLRLAAGDAGGAVPLLEQQLALAQEMGNKTCQVRALVGLSRAHLALERWEESRVIAEEGLRFAAEANLAAEESDLLLSMASIAEHDQDLERRRLLLERAVDLARSEGGIERRIRAEKELARALVFPKDLAAAEVHFAEMRRFLEQLKPSRMTAENLYFLGLAYAALAHLEEAQALLSLALEQVEEFGDLRSQALTLTQLALVEDLHGDSRSSHSRYLRALDLYQQLEDQNGIRFTESFLSQLPEVPGE